MTADLETFCERQLTRLREGGALTAFESGPPELRAALSRVVSASDFVCEALSRSPDLAKWLIDEVAAPLAEGQMAQRLARAVTGTADLAGFMTALRRQREREMVRIAWRDLAGSAAVAETLADTSAFADAAIQAAVDFAAAELGRSYGKPRSATGEEQPLIVLGMGKLGGGELNVSSDIDLIFVFPEKGETDGARRINNEDFFTRLGRLVIRIPGERTSEGFVFRVDMRLRPFGDSGPLTVSAAFLENYLRRMGATGSAMPGSRRARITGVAAWKLIHAESVRPFVYRRYLDFGVFESLREMKALIEKEVARRDLAEHMKLGPGGIREIEFIVQAFQLIRGGQDRRMQTPSLLSVLPQLAGGKLLPARVAQELEAAYLFLRRIENHLQMLADAQTHNIPVDPLTRARIAASMDFRDWESCGAELDLHRARVTRAFQEVMFARHDAAEAEAPGVNGLAEAWLRGARRSHLPRRWRPGDSRNRSAPRNCCWNFAARVRSSAWTLPGARVSTRWCRDCWAPLLMRETRGRGNASGTRLDILRRVLKVLEAIGSRSAYFALLNENAQVRRKLVELAALGEFLAAQIASHPLLLDELLDAASGGLPSPRAELEREIAARLAHMTGEEPERQVEVLRQFQRAATFRVAMADLTGAIPLMRVSDYLTEIAEIIVEQAMRLGWEQMTAHFGTPHCAQTSGAGRVVRSARWVMGS